MNSNGFGHVNRRLMAAVAVSAALLVPLAVWGAPALARSASAASEYEYGGPSQYQYKITICHRTHSKKHPWVIIRISSAAWPAHKAHGDVTPPPCPKPGAAPANKQGKGNGNGQNHGNNGHHGKK